MISCLFSRNPFTMIETRHIKSREGGCFIHDTSWIPCSLPRSVAPPWAWRMRLGRYPPLLDAVAILADLRNRESDTVPLFPLRKIVFLDTLIKDGAAAKKHMVGAIGIEMRGAYKSLSLAVQNFRVLTLANLSPPKKRHSPSLLSDSLSLGGNKWREAPPRHPHPRHPPICPSPNQRAQCFSKREACGAVYCAPQW